MYCPDKLRLNKFVQVSIPKNSDYFRRFSGNLPTPPDSQFSGDEVVPSGATKTEVLAQTARVNDAYLRDEDSKKD